MLLTGINSFYRRSERTKTTCLNLYEDNDIILGCNDIQLLPTFVHPITYQNAVTFMLQILRSHVLTLTS